MTTPLRHRLARVLSELGAPWLVNIAFFTVLGASSSAYLPGAIAAGGTGVLPMILIWTQVRRRRVSDHHVTRRNQRAGILLGISLIVIALLGILSLLDTPALIWGGMVSALGFLAAFAVVTVGMKIKASVHVGIWLCTVTYLGAGVNPWWFLGYGVIPAIAWSRLYLRDHTARDVLAGGITGLLVAIGSAAAFFS